MTTSGLLALGCAIAAEIGTMKVSEEVDALRTLGLCPHRFLVFPRMFALLLLLPLLTLAGDLVGILSGALVATSTLEIGLRKFFMSTQEALVPEDILGGLLKVSVFGMFIAGIACERSSARAAARRASVAPPRLPWSPCSLAGPPRRALRRVLQHLGDLLMA